MAKITNRMISDRFIEVFEGDQPFTPSEKKMNAIKVTQLRKTVKEHIETTNFETEKSVNEIIMEIIEYARMTNCKFRSVSSLGYDILNKSLIYWSKRKEAEEVKKFKEENSFTETENIESQPKKSYNGYRNEPKWLNIDEW